MNRKSGTSETIRVVMNDFRTLSREDFTARHGIEFVEEGSQEVYDQSYDKTFINMDEWAAFVADDEENEFEKFAYDEHEYH